MSQSSAIHPTLGSSVSTPRLHTQAAARFGDNAARGARPWARRLWGGPRVWTMASVCSLARRSPSPRGPFGNTVALLGALVPLQARPNAGHTQQSLLFGRTPRLDCLTRSAACAALRSVGFERNTLMDVGSRHMVPQTVQVALSCISPSQCSPAVSHSQLGVLSDNGSDYPEVADHKGAVLCESRTSPALQTITHCQLSSCPLFRSRN